MSGRDAARWVVAGRVQGVGFRWFTLRVAERLGLSGWARNLPDGRVEVVAAGSPRALDQLEQAIRRGPLAARVESVDKSSDVSPEDTLPNSFDIK